MRTDVKTWPQLLPFRQPMPAGRQSLYFVVAVFVSMVMHAFLLWVVATVRTAVESTPSIGTPMIVSLVSLSTLAADSRDGLDREPVPAVPDTGQPDRLAQPSSERYHSAERKAEVEAVVTSKGQGVPDSEAPMGKPLATDAIEAVVTSKGKGFPGSKAPEGKSLGTGAAPSFDLEAAYGTAREVGQESMSESEVQSLRFAQIRLTERNDMTETKVPRLNCRTAYKKKELLVIPLAIINFGCEW